MNTSISKIITLGLGSLVCLLGSSWAQSGPSPSGYTWQDGASVVSYDWIRTTDHETILSGNNAAQGLIDLKVPWGGIYGVPVSQLNVSRNGYLTNDTADNGSDDSNDCPLPARLASADGWRIYVLHDDLELHGTLGRVRYHYYPESPHGLHGCGVHVVTWENMYHAGTSGSFSFQALLFDNLDMVFQYTRGNVETGGGSTTGIQNALSSKGLTVACDRRNSIPENYAVLIRPPVSTVTTHLDQLDTPAGGALSLREALRDAPSGSRLVFSASLEGDTIDLSGVGAPLTLSQQVCAIDATALTAPLYVSGNETVGHFSLTSGAWLSLQHLHLELGDGSVSSIGGSTLIACDTTWFKCQSESTGAIRVQGGAVSFYDCRFTGNQSSAYGGAVSVRAGGVLCAEKCKFLRNSSGGFSTEGGAVFLEDASATFRFCEFTLNESGTGAGVFASDEVALECFACTFDSNRASNSGGGFGTRLPSNSAGNSSAHFKRCTFFQNSANDGGAVYQSKQGSHSFGTSIQMEYCTLYQNRAQDDGGAFFVDDTDVVLVASVMANNTARDEGPQLSIQVGGTGGIEPIFDTANIETGDEGNFSMHGGISNVTDIALADLGHYGGCVRVCMPLQHSPVIDRALFSSGLAGPTDARGFPALRDGGALGGIEADVGAVELGPTVHVTSTSPTGAGSLQEAVDTVEDGGVVSFDGVNRVGLTDDLTVPAGKTVFVDGSTEHEVILESLGFELEDGQNLALYAIRALGDPAGSKKLNVTASQFTTDHCVFSLYSSTSNLLTISSGDASILHSEFSGIVLPRNNERAMIRVNGPAGCFFLRDSVIAHNRIRRGWVVSASNAPVVMQRTSLVDNVCQASGRGLFWNMAGSTARPFLYLEDSTFSRNVLRSTSAPSAVFVGNYTSDPNVVELAHNTIVGNRINNTFSSSSLGALYVLGASLDAQVTGNILADNTDEDGVLRNFFGSVGSVSIADDNLSDSSPAFFTGSDIPNTDPMLSPLVLGPNKTWVHVPRPGSPCIDAAGLGSPARIFDGRGSLREYDGSGNGLAQRDIGAVESGRVYMVTTAADEEGATLGTGTGDSLTECIFQLAVGEEVLNIGFDPSVHGAVLTRTVGSYGTGVGVVDMDGMNTGIVIDNRIVASSAGTISVTGLTIRELQTSHSAVLSAGHCTVKGDAFDSNIKALSASRIALKCSVVTECTPAANLLFVSQQSEVSIEDSAVFDNVVSFANLRAISDSRLILRNTSMTRNPGWYPIEGLDDNYTQVEGCTFARNGGRIANKASHDMRVRDSVLVTHPTQTTPFTDSNVVSYGGNLTDRNVSDFDHESDLLNRSAYLAPLADYESKGVPHMPPLAASPIFNTITGAAAPPKEVLVVTTADDENDTPAGSELSLREAVREIAPGGTIIFDSNLNNKTFKLTLTDQLIAITKSITIDATALPKGIDFVGRLTSVLPQFRLALHGVHMRDWSSGASLLRGGALGVVGKLMLSHCAFSGNRLTGLATEGGAISLRSGVLTAENCTFSDNEAKEGSAIYLALSQARLDFCTFGEGVSNGAAISGFSSNVTLYGTSIFGNETAGGVPNGTIASTVSLTSLGSNGFTDAPTGAVASDITGDSALHKRYGSFGDAKGGWVGGYEPTSTSSIINHTPSIVFTQVSAPEHDARGYLRVADSSADLGALEHDGDVRDHDGDMLPTWWERYWGFDAHSPNDAAFDVDGDYRTLLEEFQWRTDPFDSASAFTLDHVIDAFTMDITWQAVPGCVYGVDIGTDMVNWPTTIEVTADEALESIVVPVSGTRLFSRIRRLR